MDIKKVIIIGGFGFIGKALIRKLAKKNLKIIIIEHPDIIVPKGFENFELVRCDITKTDEINKLTFKNIDAVLHLAAQSSGPRSFHIPYEDINLNIIGTLNIIHFCINNSIKRILFASTFAVYGDNDESIDTPVNEKKPCNPKSIYANSKYFCENLLKNYAEAQGMYWNSLRMFNVYGPGQDITKTDQGVVGIFLNMLLKSKTVCVKGSLDRFRDLIYIEDVVDAWLKILFSNKINQVFNVGTGTKTNFRELIFTIANCLKISDPNVIEEGGTPGDQKGCFADISKLRNLTNFEPNYNLKKGLNEMIKFYV